MAIWSRPGHIFKSKAIKISSMQLFFITNMPKTGMAIVFCQNIKSFTMKKLRNLYKYLYLTQLH